MSCNWLAVLNPCNMLGAVWRCTMYVWRRLTGCCTTATVSGMMISPTLARLSAASRALRRLLTPQWSTSSEEGPLNEAFKASETSYQNPDAVPVSGVSNEAYSSDSDESPRNVDPRPQSLGNQALLPPKPKEKDSGSSERSIQTDSSTMVTASLGSSSDLYYSLDLNDPSCEQPSGSQTQTSPKETSDTVTSNLISDSTEKKYGTF